MRLAPARPARSICGATLIEFALALVLGVLPLVLGILQVAQLLVAANVVNLATFLAARQGTVHGADPVSMRRELARGLVPLYVRAARDGVASGDSVASAYAVALLDVTTLDSLQVENPSRAALDRYGEVRAGARVIPNDAIEFRSRALQDANVLTIAVVHCQPLAVPLAGPALAAALVWLDTAPQHHRCIGAGRAPLFARASLVMQSDVRAEALQ